MPTIETVELGLKWIELFPKNVKNATWIINFLFSTEREDVLKSINTWYKIHPDHPLSKFIQRKLGEYK